MENFYFKHTIMFKTLVIKGYFKNFLNSFLDFVNIGWIIISILFWILLQIVYMRAQSLEYFIISKLEYKSDEYFLWMEDWNMNIEFMFNYWIFFFLICFIVVSLLSLYHKKSNLITFLINIVFYSYLIYSSYHSIQIFLYPDVI